MGLYPKQTEIFGSYVAGGTIPKASRVKLDPTSATTLANRVVVAAATDTDIGVQVGEWDSLPGDHVKVLHVHAPGTFHIRAGGSIPAGGKAKKAASGKVAMDGAGVAIVEALQPAAVDGDIILVHRGDLGLGT